ncbi:MAG: hypothetical protein DRJ52_07435 [Thermoprotei archaeon]|mgnify:CR=1 FL=1|nr:MAG: hypothetical protein DRJ52_07435 [Thermoprotei archaeon]RLE97010.1 MAG: hypothetical protein DRJ63_09770 [Thermoprotei archaeon]
MEGFREYLYGLIRPKRFEWSIWSSWFIELCIEEALEKISGVGFRYVELSAEHFNEMLARSGEVYLDSSSSSRAIAVSDNPFSLPEFIQRVESFGIEIIHAHGPFDLADFTSKSMYDRLKEAEKWIEYASKLNIPILVCHPFSIRSLSLKKCKEINIKFYNQVSKCCKKYGVKVALENIGDGNRYGSKISDLIEIIEAVSREELGVCLDTGHANIGGYEEKVEEAVLESGKLLIASHLNDNNGREDQHLMIGRGNIDWIKVLKAFRRVNYRKPLNLEIPGESGGLSLSDKEAKLCEIFSFLKEKYSQIS